jgi:hypothetical protein
MSDNAQPVGGLRNGEDDGAGLPPRDDAADQRKLEELAWEAPPTGWSPSPQPVAPPANNVMLHAYGVMSERHAQMLRDMKDCGLTLWGLMRLADDSVTDGPWNSRELETAATRLEESLLWAEKHFVV